MKAIQLNIPVVANTIMDATYPESQVTMSPAHIIGTLSETQTSGRKRIAPCNAAENSLERRQKRMIKNRESALDHEQESRSFCLHP